MKILCTVEQYHPSVGGMQEVVKQLAERWVQSGNEVSVATSYHGQRTQDEINGVKIIQFNVSGNSVHGYRWGDTEKYRNFLRESKFDVVIQFAAQQWATDLALDILGEIKGKKVLVPTGFSALYDPSFANYFEKLPQYLRQYDAHVFHSNDYRDIHFARTHCISNLHVIPNGASAEEFHMPTHVDIRLKLGIPRSHFLILLVGSHTGVKGHYEAIDIFSEAAIPNSTLLIVGNDFDDHGCSRGCKRRESFLANFPRVRINRGRKIFLRDFAKSILSFAWLTRSKRNLFISRNLSREDTVAAYHAADLFLFPSRIECSPIVLFESMASRTPILTAEVGNTREIIAWSKSGVVLPTDVRHFGSFVKIKDSGKILREISSDRPQLAQMAESGYRAFDERFGWHKIAKMYEDLFVKILTDAN